MGVNSDLGLKNGDLLKMYEFMLIIREFEETTDALYKKNIIYGGVHLGIGQEALMVGSCYNLAKEDKICNSHRGHGQCIVKGVDAKRVMAELLARSTGVSKGNGGSMHLCDETMGILGTHSCLGDMVNLAVGVALSTKMQKKKDVTICYFGDGCINTGALHEGMNMAVVMELPIVFICENNGYGMSLKVENAMKVKSISDRFAGYGIKTETVDGNDVLEVYQAVQKAAAGVRNGSGPLLLDCKTYRWYGHMVGDPEVYRTRDEVNKWKENDPIRRFEKYLLTNAEILEEEIGHIKEKAKKVVQEAVEFGLNSPEPTLEELYKYVYFDN